MSTTATAKSERIGDLLLREGLITKEQLDRALQEQRQSGTRVGYNIVKLGYLPELEVTKTLARQYKMPAVDLSKFEVDPKIAKLIPADLALKNLVLPLKRDGRTLTVAMADPTDFAVIDDLKFITRYDIFPVIAGEFTIRNVLEKLYESSDAQMSTLLDDIAGMETDEELEVVETKDEDISATALAAQMEEAPVVKLINAILTDAVRRGASDIHFECFEHDLRVRYRVDGELEEIMKPPKKMQAALVSRFKIMSSLNIAERRVPQDGRIKMRLSKNRAIDFRVSTCPTLFGEKVVTRILDPSSAMLGIDALGYEPLQREMYLKYLAKPQGMILVTGPTGSGKTVSLYTGLNILNTEDCNISTAEDPAEINLPGINQVNVNNKVGLTFASALRAFLRQDPDVIMVGEIRDLETAEIAIKAAQTGHLVLSTLHTNDAPQTLTRLVDMGVKPYAIATSVSLIIAQRLARKLCNNCKQIIDIPAEALKKEGFEPADIEAGFKVFRAVGCGQCTDGYKGRMGIYQVMPVTEQIGRIIMQGGGALDINDQATKDGIWNLRRSGLQKVRDGVTSLEEVNSVTID
jgi:type IV pilus assembly protein PilB